MRSSPFLILSVAVHFAAIGAFVLTPRFEESPEAKAENAEVSVNQVETEVAAPEAAPAPPFEAAPAQQLKRPKASVAALLKREPKPTPAVQMKNDVPHGETLDPQTTEDDESTEAAAEQAEAEDPAPVGYSEPSESKAQGETPTDDAATQDAVSYLNLKQASGNKPPFYPVAARRERRQGDLELVYRVTHDGLVADVSVAKSSGFQDLDKAAVDAVSKYRFEPGQEGWARHPIAFTLKGPEEELPSQLRTGSPQTNVE